jgi:hypothetical protein
MVQRYVRKSAILLAIETTYGTDAAPAGSTDALLVSEMTINPFNASNVDRKNIRPFFGGSEQLLGNRYVELTFTVELAGSGTLGTAPAWGRLMRACKMAEVVEAGVRVDYTPISDSIESATVYYYDDGALHKLLGARGDVTNLMLKQGDIPKVQVRIMGLYAPITAATPSGVAYTAWKTPQVVTNSNTGDITIGGSVNPTGVPLITGGTAYTSTGLELKFGNALVHTPLLGEESIDITDHNITGSMQLNLSAAQEVTFAGHVELATLQNLSLLHGTVATRKVMVNLPFTQLKNYTKQELNGRRMIGYELSCIPQVGGDEFRLTTSF